MALLGLVNKWTSSKFLEPLRLVEVSVREASKKAGGSTRNRCQYTTGKKRGLKVYDGQRVPSGKILVSQYRLHVLPGWNTTILPNCCIMAQEHGRVVLTTEKIDPKIEAYGKLPPRLGEVLPKHLLEEKIFRLHAHVIPDEQHQYFQLTEQV